MIPNLFPFGDPAFRGVPLICVHEFPILSDSLIFHVYTMVTPLHFCKTRRKPLSLRVFVRVKPRYFARLLMDFVHLSQGFLGFPCGATVATAWPCAWPRGFRGFRAVLRCGIRRLIYIYRFPWVIIIPNFGKSLHSPLFTHQPG